MKIVFNKQKDPSDLMFINNIINANQNKTETLDTTIEICPEQF